MSEDLNYAITNRTRLINAIPKRLLEREDRLLERIRKANAAPMKKLEMLYSFMEELSKVTSRFMPCKRGCSGCCHYNVSVSLVEIEYIERKTKHRRESSMGVKQDFHGQPCVFLENGACSIYEARPFVCRRHHALTPTSHWCQPARSGDQEFPLIAFSGVDASFDHIRLGSGSAHPVDIRQAFSSTKRPP